jgi:multimeric flavodoxin WrbA
MSVKTIFYSYSGITGGIAQQIHDACGGELVEVQPVKPYSKITAYTRGCRRATKGMCDDIEPASIDVSESDIIVIGTPVWAFRAAPPVNAAVEALTGCGGKTAILFATCKGTPKDTLPLLAEALAAKDVRIAGEYVLDKDDVRDRDRIDALIAAVASADGGA